MRQISRCSYAHALHVLSVQCSHILSGDQCSQLFSTAAECYMSLDCMQSVLQRGASSGSTWRHRVAQARAIGLAAFMRLYPWLHMLQEGLSFSYQLAYLLQASPYFSPTLHLLRQHVERASGQQLVSLAPWAPCAAPKSRYFILCQ